MASSLARAAASPFRARLASAPSISSPSSSLLSRNPQRYGFYRIWPQRVELNLSAHAPRLKSMFRMQNIFGQSLHLSGRKMFTGSFIGLSSMAAMMHESRNVAYAMDEHHIDFVEPSGYLKDDLNTFWALARKFQLPVVLLLMVLLGWRHPITLAVNVVLLLFCTRPNPYSIYLFVDQLRQREMRRSPSLHNTKFLYAKKVDVEDYKLVCVGKVELRDRKLYVIGILGGWWILHVSVI